MGFLIVSVIFAVPALILSRNTLCISGYGAKARLICGPEVYEIVRPAVSVGFGFFHDIRIKHADYRRCSLFDLAYSDSRNEFLIIADDSDRFTVFVGKRKVRSNMIIRNGDIIQVKQGDDLVCSIEFNRG